ncbi:unnamed protein product [Anisakis simplex]|uniref:Epimerase domain-containing protein n=1 Tax=Anisakis simplex TaxID=6269 RepID=A0A0M3J170_ANISI|nr:unnamed protein product [Anisakis simplex]
MRNPIQISPLLALKYSSERLELVEADLEHAEDWSSVLDGCDYILHVASPWPIIADENTVKVAVEGTTNILKVAAKIPTIKKIVLTSSCSAINDGHKNGSRIFNEECWTDLQSDAVENYARSKTIAERTAWDMWHAMDPDNRFQLTVINPSLVVGPVLSNQPHGSATIMGRMMSRRDYLASPKVSIGLVDVRDVARAHITAMTTPESDGHRILVTATPCVWFGDITRWLRKEFKSQGYDITQFVIPNWILRLYNKTGVDPQTNAIMHRLGPELRFNNTKRFGNFLTSFSFQSKKLLKMEYTDPQESIIDMMYSMIEHGMVKRTSKFKPPPNPSNKVHCCRIINPRSSSTII